MGIWGTLIGRALPLRAERNKSRIQAPFCDALESRMLLNGEFAISRLVPKSVTIDGQVFDTYSAAAIDQAGQVLVSGKSHSSVPSPGTDAIVLFSGSTGQFVYRSGDQYPLTWQRTNVAGDSRISSYFFDGLRYNVLVGTPGNLTKAVPTDGFPVIDATLSDGAPLNDLGQIAYTATVSTSPLTHALFIGGNQVLADGPNNPRTTPDNRSYTIDSFFGISVGPGMNSSGVVPVIDSINYDTGSGFGVGPAGPDGFSGITNDGAAFELRRPVTSLSPLGINNQGEILIHATLYGPEDRIVGLVNGHVVPTAVTWEPDTAYTLGGGGDILAVNSNHITVNGNTVVAKNTPAPGFADGSVVASFRSACINSSGTVVFTASVQVPGKSGFYQAIYAYMGGALHVISDGGPIQLTTGEVLNVPIYSDSVSNGSGQNGLKTFLNDKGQVVFPTSGASRDGLLIVDLNEFASNAPGAIHGIVWNDANANGVHDSGEDGIANVQIQLKDSSGHAVGNPIETKSDGTYRFDNLPIGIYSIHVTRPAGSTGFSTVGDSGLNLSGDSGPITVASGGDVGVNAGVQFPTTPIPPAAFDTDTNVTKTASSYTFKVSYYSSGTAAIKTSTLGNKNIQVTGPHNFKQSAKLVSKSPASGDATVLVATYKITPPGGSWDTADNGTYSIKALANQVKDTAGIALLAGNLGTFTVKIAHKSHRVDQAKEPTVSWCLDQ